MPFKAVVAPKCARCNKSVFANEETKVVGKSYHNSCFKCKTCNSTLTLTTYSPSKDNDVYCNRCFAANFAPEGFREGGSQTSVGGKFVGDSERKQQIAEEKARQDAAQLKPTPAPKPAPAKAKFCTECGTKSDGGKFCSECGHKAA